MDWTVRYTAPARKNLERLPAKIVQRVQQAITKLIKDPRPSSCKKLKGKEDTYRIRVGDYRVVYEIHDKGFLILIIRIGHRKDIYDK